SPASWLVVAMVFGGVIWRFLRNGNVMWMALPDASRCDPDEPRFRTQVFNGWSSAVAHACSKSPYQLVDERSERTFVGHASLDCLGNEFAIAPVIVDVALAIAFLRSMNHGRQRPHAAVS